MLKTSLADYSHYISTYEPIPYLIYYKKTAFLLPPSEVGASNITTDGLFSYLSSPLCVLTQWEDNSLCY